MSERHIKLCERTINWDRISHALDRSREQEMYEAHSPELLLAMHQALAASQAMFKEMEDSLGAATTGSMVKRFTIPSKMIGLREAVARYEELVLGL